MGAGIGRAVGVCVVVALATVLAACGGKDEKAAKPAAARSAATAKPAAPEDQLANAVPVGKTPAVVNLQYEIKARPVAGQPVEIRLVFTPRTAADTLEFTAKGMPGLDVASGGSGSFTSVTGGSRFTASVFVQGAAAGLYYVSVESKLTSKIESSARAFSVPLVVVAAATDAAPAAAPAAPAKK
jgi:hypothetical protein